MSNNSRDSNFRTTFVHFCPACNRRLMLEVASLGKLAKCDGCGRSSVARDREIESAALLDDMKLHAELAAHPATEYFWTQRPR